MAKKNLDKPDKKKVPRIQPGQILAAGGVLVAILGIVTAGYFYWQFSQEKQNNPFSEVGEITRQVEKFMLLPDETPTLATVTDQQALSDQGFFTEAQNGDKVLVFLNAKKAILYRPSIKKVIDVSSVQTIEDGNQMVEGEFVIENSNFVESDASLVVYNGTAVSGLAKNVSSLIRGNVEGVTVIGGTDARVKGYTETTVVDVSGGHTEKVDELAQYLSAKVGVLPAREASPEADILVIVGSDFAQE